MAAPAQTTESADVVVVGGGNAGYCAAHAAALRGRRVILIERAPTAEAGGNSFFTAGAIRMAHDGLDDLLDLVEPDARLPRSEVPPYSAAQFRADMERTTSGRCDPQLTDVLVAESAPAVRWLKALGMSFRLMYERQAYQRPDDSYLFWGGLAVGSTGGGKGLMAGHQQIAARLGVDVRYQHGAVALRREGDGVSGVRWVGPDDSRGLREANAVVLAAGGFEANPSLRQQYLGEGWQRAKVRGTPLNDGRMLRAAIDVGAACAGDWSTAHSVAWDAGAPPTGDRALTNQLTRQSYPLGIVVNRHGRRFFDEGADFRNYTYARYGADILRQPGSIAFQIFDAAVRPLLRPEEYDSPGVSEHIAATIGELALACGIDADALGQTITKFNAAVRRDVPFDPTVRDGRSAALPLPKTNWANPIETPPFYAYPVTCGITFTFGGLRADPSGRVLDESGAAIPGLHVCGEMLGGLFSGNYPGGSGLTAGLVFGRRAGEAARTRPRTAHPELS
jgi:tricarballylate dehydrogenase